MNDEEIKEFETLLGYVADFGNPNGRGFHDGSLELSMSELKHFTNSLLEKRDKKLKERIESCQTFTFKPYGGLSNEEYIKKSDILEEL